MTYIEKYLNNKDMTTDDIIQLWNDTFISDPWNLCSAENLESLTTILENIKVFSITDIQHVDFGCGKMALLTAISNLIGKVPNYLGIDVPAVYNRLSVDERFKFSSLNIKETTPNFLGETVYWFINSLYYLYKDDKVSEKHNLKELFKRLNSNYYVLVNSGFNYYPAMEVLRDELNYKLVQDFEVVSGNPNPDFCTTYRVKIFKKGDL